MTTPPDQRPAKTIGPDRKRTAVCFIPWGVFTYYIALSVLGMIYMVYGAWETNPLKVGAGLATMVNYFWSLCTFHYVKITPGEIIRYSFLACAGNASPWKRSNPRTEACIVPIRSRGVATGPGISSRPCMSFATGARVLI